MYYFPYTNFHDINLDWIIEHVKSAKSEIEDLINHFENLIVQTTGDSTNKVMSQNAVTVQLNYLSSRINSLNTTVEELTNKVNQDIANLASFEGETESNFNSDRTRLSTIENDLASFEGETQTNFNFDRMRITTIENTIARFYVVVSHTETENTINVSMSDLANYRARANARYYFVDSVKNFVRCAYEADSPHSMTVMIQTLPFTDENAVYRATIDMKSGGIIYSSVGIVPISQSSGQSQTSVMSQKAATDELNKSLRSVGRYGVNVDGKPYDDLNTLPGNNMIEYVNFDGIANKPDGDFISAQVHTYRPYPQSSLLIESFYGRTPNNLLTLYIRNQLPTGWQPWLKVNTANIVQNSGKSDTDVMSQRAVTDLVNTSNLPRYPRFVIQYDGETVASGQLSTLQNILNAIVVNKYSPQIYLNITTDNVTEQLYVDSAKNRTGYVLRNNNYIITYTTAPSVTIEPVEKVFTSSTTGFYRIAEGPEKGYNILQIIGMDVDLTNYYIVDADITKLTGGDSTLISVSPVSGHPVILIYTNGVAFSGSWTVTCRHK